jgi:tellurite methyltransferase
LPLFDPIEHSVRREGDALSETHEYPKEPADFLARNLALLPRGRALDVAMGDGRNAIFLAGHGFAVEGIDLSREAVAASRTAARKAGVSLDAKVADLESGFTLREQKYDLIICFRYLHRPLIPTLKCGLRTNGMIVYETYIVDQARFGKPRNPDHLLGRNELLRLFQEFRCLRYHEGIFEGPRALAGIIAQKVEP